YNAGQNKRRCRYLNEGGFLKNWIMMIVVGWLLGYAVYDFFGTQTDDGAEVVDANVGIEKGDMAPDFELETLDGGKVKLSDLRGEKVMINFWATWCPPCRAEMPDIQKFHENEEGTIVSVNLTDTENSVRNVEDFIDEYDITFDVLYDPDSSIGTRYEAQALPTSYLINTKGEIHNIAVGPLNYEQMVQAFDEMD